ncbi:hypothetical protein Glove_120g225 [Diversispora epigaea]|uniref:Phospholipid/glycerol acyltransferase domain-containing protein n=1 Tax=Diversispora epigaea TaxID=1348612 RepID=A0A397IZB2_9GLOM|nr:hypothetical protein Glove_120g225 [Diversispora epigaea]
MLKHLAQALRLCFYGTALFSFALSINIVQICSLLLISPFSRRILWNINSRGAHSMWWIMQYIFEHKHKAKITFSGDQIPSNESAIVISNHRSYSDFYMLHSVAMRRKMLPHVKYFAKDSLKYIPFFGFGMWLMGMIFIKRNWTEDENHLKKIFKAIKSYAAPIWIVNFVEGTRFSPKKLMEGQQFSMKRGFPVFQNLLFPRTKGFVACVRQLRDTHVKYVYDFTIVYRHITRGLNFPPNLFHVHGYPLLSPPWSFHVHVKRYAIEDLPRDEEKLTEWVRQKFIEKDALLEDMKLHWTKSEKLKNVHEEKYF